MPIPYNDRARLMVNGPVCNRALAGLPYQPPHSFGGYGDYAGNER
jgi:hypothetical protein